MRRSSFCLDEIGGHVTPACAVQGGLSASFEAAARTDLGLKTGDAIPVEGFLPLRKFFLGEHIAVVGFEPAKYPAANRDHDPGFFPSAPPCQTGWRDEENFLLGHSALALVSVVVVSVVVGISFYAALRRRPITPSPTRAVPKIRSEAGSGTG